jgi:hypothetical protein
LFSSVRFSSNTWPVLLSSAIGLRRIAPNSSTRTGDQADDRS